MDIFKSINKKSKDENTLGNKIFYYFQIIYYYNVLFYVCAVYLCAHVCMQLQVHMCTHVCGDHKSMLCIFLYQCLLVTFLLL